MRLLLLLLTKSSCALFVGALATSVLGGLGGVALVAAIHRALAAPPAQLPQLGLRFAALSATMLLLRWLSQRLFVSLSQATLASLRLHVSRRLAHAPFRAFEARGVAQLSGVLTDDIGAVAELFATLPRLFVHGAVLLGCLGYLALLSVRVFAFALAIVGLGLLAHYRASLRANDYVRRARADEDRLYEHFRALFAGAKELKLHRARRDAFVARVLGGGVDAVRRTRTRGLLIYALSASGVACLFFVVTGAVLFVFGGTGAGADAAAVRSGYALVLLYMMLPVHVWLEAIPELGRTRVALERIEAVIGAAPEPRAAPPACERDAAPFESLQLRAVTHSYRREAEDGVFTLGPIDLALRPGELVFLIGGNGSGKTTLAKLLVGLYEPEAGQVLLNGRPVDADARAAYSQHFSAVFSDFHLFESLLGIEVTRLDERAQALLVALDLERKVSIRDGVFSSTELSSGQRKRLALLVAWLEDRPVYVFDEWAADQDPEYRQVFYHRVLPELRARGKAVLVVTHDDSYFHLADRCLKLESGRLLTSPTASSTRAPRPSSGAWTFDAAEFSQGGE